MTLGLIFNHLVDKTHFGAFFVFYTNYSLIFGDKKIKNQKWFMREKFQHQKLGVTKGFFIVIFFLFSISTTFQKNDRSATWKPNRQNFFFDGGKLRNSQRYQKYHQLRWSFNLIVSYSLEPTVQENNTYYHFWNKKIRQISHMAKIVGLQKFA